jgi:hypothetical protein
MELELIRPIFQALSAVDVMPLIKLYIRMITADQYWLDNITSDEDLKVCTRHYDPLDMDEDRSYRLVVTLWTPLFASPLEVDIIVRSLTCYFRHTSNSLYDHDNDVGLLRLINKISDEYTIKYFSTIDYPGHLDCFIMYKNIKYHHTFMRRVYNKQYNLFRLEQSMFDL